jgi:hypothetical protein
MVFRLCGWWYGRAVASQDRCGHILNDADLA